MKLTKFFALMCATVVGFTACTDPDEPVNEPVIEPVGAITLTAEKTSVSVGEEIKFTVTDSIDQNVTKLATIYDPDLNIVKNGKCKISTPGSYEFYATLNGEISNTVTIIVSEVSLELPEDPQPDNYAFNHRAVIIDHTAVNCGYCPQMTDKLLALAETEWHKHYNEVTCHAGTLSSGDPAKSAAADILNSFQSQYIEGYPNICINFHTATVGNYSQSAFLRYMGEAFEAYINKDGADVGISMAAAVNVDSIICAAQIKSNVTQEYAINAWLLENNIYSPNQAGAQKDYHKIYNYALRNTSEGISRTNLAGCEIGVVEKGKTYDYAANIPLTSTKWVAENMGVLIIVSAKDAQGRWEVVNTAYCKAGESKAYEYVEE